MKGIKPAYKLAAVLTLILLLALTIRVYKAGGTFPSNDNVDPAITALHILSLDWNFKTFTARDDTNPFARLIIHPLGTSHIIVTFANAVILFKILGLNVTEFHWILPFLIIGVLNILAVFFLVRQISTPRAAINSALFLSVLPIHVAQSRTITSPIIIGLLFLTLFTLFIVRYAQKKEMKDALLAGIFAAVGITTNSLFLGMIPLGGYILLREQLVKQKTKRKAITQTFKDLLRKELIGPPLIVFLILLTIHLLVVVKTGISCYDIIGHTFSGGKNRLGDYSLSAVNWLIQDASIIISALIVIGALVGFYDTYHKRKESILFVWGIVFLLPFFFLVPPDATQTYQYMVYGIFALCAYAAVLVDRFFSAYRISQILKCLILTLIFASAFYTTLIGVNRVALPNPLNLKTQANYGIATPDTGAKAAGWWVRQHTPTDAVIFSDAINAQAIELPIGQYYFGRKMIASVNANPEEITQLLRSRNSSYSFVVTNPENEMGTVSQIDSAFQKAAIITDKENVRVIIYELNRTTEPDYVDIIMANNEFDEKYGNLQALTAARFTAEERERHTHFRAKCEHFPLHRLYLRAGIIRMPPE